MVFKKKNKYEIYGELKLMKCFFKTIKRSSEPLDLIYLDIGDLKFVRIKDEKIIILLL
jgi:hypothetical protein